MINCFDKSKNEMFMLHSQTSKLTGDRLKSPIVLIACESDIQTFISFIKVDDPL